MIELFHKFAKRPMEYGVDDCCQFVGACLKARHGVNPALEFLYEGKDGAQALIDSYGGLPDLLTSVFGEPHDEAEDGAVAYVDDLDMVGYVYRDRIVVRTATDLTDLPLSRARRFWWKR